MIRKTISEDASFQFDTMKVFRSAPGRDSFLQSRCPRDSRRQLSYIRCLEPATFKRVPVHELQLEEDKNAPRAANYGAAESGSLLTGRYFVFCILYRSSSSSRLYISRPCLRVYFSFRTTSKLLRHASIHLWVASYHLRQPFRNLHLSYSPSLNYFSTYE